MTSAPDANPFGRLRVWYPQIGSTMDVAGALAVHGAPNGTLVETDFQTAGRGRQGRQWLAPPGSALLSSWILRPPDGHDTGVLSPMIALALLRALQHLKSTIPVGYKWPNDVWIGDRKAAGILLTARHAGGEPVVIAGVGVNIVRNGNAPPERAWVGDWLPGVTSGRVREALAAELGGIWSRYIRCGCLADDGRAELESAMVWRDHTVEVREAGGTVRGTMVRLESDGALVMQSEGGDPVIVRTGEVVRGPRIAARIVPEGAVYFPEQDR
ncbi:MAG TPA: biotin--[acetyl-CoA-carboxylase] ligase [Thermomicrobiales bacterium]|nr:biotin--[acetyl-CoA-carboxylase] ligase [Thermomicrobiales bacterium]